MTQGPGRLPPQPWMTDPAARAVIAALDAEGAEVRFVGGCHHVFGIASGRQSEQHATIATVGLNLAGINALEPVIVAPGGHRGGVGRQRDDVVAVAFAQIAADQLAGNVQGISGRTTIAADQKRFAGGQGRDNQGRCLVHFAAEILIGDRLDRFHRAGEIVVQPVHGSSYSLFFAA